VATDIYRQLPWLIRPIADFFVGFVFKSAQEGAQTSIYLAVSDEVEGVSGRYFVDCKEANMSKAAIDKSLAKKLWEKSEDLVGLKPEEIDL